MQKKRDFKKDTYICGKRKVVQTRQTAYLCWLDVLGLKKKERKVIIKDA